MKGFTNAPHITKFAIGMRVRRDAGRSSRRVHGGAE